MPAYDYVCKDCGKDFTLFLTLKEYEAHPKIKCPHCKGGRAERKISGFFAKTSRKS